MKDFLKNVLSTVVGLIVFSVLMFILGIIGFVSILFTTSSKPEISDNSVLTINLSGMMEERKTDNIIDKVFNEVSSNSPSLEDLIVGLKKAKSDDKIKGVYIEAGAFATDSYASAQAARNALLDFKKSGKWIIAYADTYTQISYYISSVADKIYLNPQGQLDWHGLSVQRVYLKDLLAKVGVKMQVSKVGKYKSATETFTGTKMSDADKAQTKALIEEIWNNIVNEVGNSRHLSKKTLNAYADEMITWRSAKDYIKLGLIDGLLYTDQVKDVVKKRLNIDKDQLVNQVSLSDMKNISDISTEGDEVAVYYACGDIVDGELSNNIKNKSVIDAQKVTKDLEGLMNDDKVKAVVLRVNSGGGSAYASEQIWHQLTELRKKKPVVVSMGGYAASGGYYISAPANWIVAEPTTVTGSIGIFGMFPDLSSLYKDKLGLKLDEVKTNKNSTFGSVVRPFNSEELNMLQMYIDRGYMTFKSRVAQGRKMNINKVEELAQGHVYTGEDAKRIGLVDALGGLDTAIVKAAQLAHIKKYYPKSYPAPIDWSEQLFNTVNSGNYLDEELKRNLGSLYEPLMIMKSINSQSRIQAHIPYYMLIN